MAEKKAETKKKDVKKKEVSTEVETKVVAPKRKKP
jgi:hypothetical protein